MNVRSTKQPGPVELTRGRETALRWCWLTLVSILTALYIGWGGVLPVGFLPLIPAWFLYRSSKRAAPHSQPAGILLWFTIGMAILVAIGVLLLPVNLTPTRLQRLDASDRDAIEMAVEDARAMLQITAERASDVMEASDQRVARQQMVEEFWSSVADVSGGDAVAISWVADNPVSFSWAGSPFMFSAAIPVVTSHDRPELSNGESEFVIAGDHLAATAHLVYQVGQEKVVISALLARMESASGPAPGVEPLLNMTLSSRLIRRIEIRESEQGEGSYVTIGVRDWTRDTIPYPARNVAQIVMLISLLGTSLSLLLKESSSTRGLIAAPLIYASAVPLLLGEMGRPLQLDLITPSWTGYQLTNQAFIAVAAAGLALWFALQVRERVSGYLNGRYGKVIIGCLLAGITLLWMVGLGLMQDLYRFAPTWFWARLSFLPAVKDLIGWLIAIAMTLTVIGGAGGSAAILRQRWGSRGLLYSTAAAAAGGAAASLTGAWSGNLFIGTFVALSGTLMTALLLDYFRKRGILITLLGLALLGACVHLPVKSELGKVMIRRVINESAESLKGTGVGLDSEQVAILGENIQEAAAGLTSFKAGGDRTAYLVWKQLGLDQQDIAGGVLVVDIAGSVTGRFSTESDIFEISDLDSTLARVVRGEGRMVLTGGSPAYFGEETLLMAVPGPDRRGSLLVALKRKPLRFLSTGESRLWLKPEPSGISERSGRLAGLLFVRIYDEAYRLLTLPINPGLATAPSTVPAYASERLRSGSESGVWFRRGWWMGGGADEYYFWLETPWVRTSVPGGEVTAVVSVERRIACLGVLRTGLWGKVVEALNVLLLFIGTMMLLAWLPAAVVVGSGVVLSNVLKRISFRTRLLIPLLVVSLVPLVALWMLTRGFILNREETTWEASLDENLQEVQRSILGQTEEWAGELARESEFGGTRLAGEQGGGTQWALFDANLVKTAGTLTDSLADRIPLRELVIGRGRRSFVFRSGNLWVVAVVPVGPRYAQGAALIVRPFSTDLLRQASEHSRWQVDLFLDGRLNHSTEPAPYTAGLLAPMLASRPEWEGSRGRDVAAFRWGELDDLRYLFAYRPLTDYSGIAVATISQRRFGFWGQNDPALARLFTTMASIYILLVVAVTLVALMVARRISQPVGSLTRSAGRVAGGDLDVTIPVTRGDEIGGLQKAFRQMVVALRENRDELARAERERAWQEMARQVAHEIKNPLTPMKLSAQFLRRAYDEGTEDLDRILHECTDAIVEQVEGLRRIADEFSAYARLPVVRREPTDLNEPLEEALNLYVPALSEGIKVVRGLDTELPTALLDSEQIRRVAINLIRNSLDAMGEEGVLTVTSGHDGQEVWLQVSDTGEGIAPEVQERLFEPYFSTKTDGTGLGLAITMAIVDAYGGSLTVDSRPGEGTTMTARFPLD